MNKHFKCEKGIQNWYKDLNNNVLILGDDIDSLASTYILKQLFTPQLGIFYDFKALYYRADINPRNIKTSQILGVDIDLAKNKCIGNHVTYRDNPDCISLNKGIPHGNSNYYNKFAGSTLVTILSLYDIDISDLTQQQLELLLCVDTAFKQYYIRPDRFDYYYNDVLQYPIFIDIVKGKDMEYFYKIIRKYGLEKKIVVDDDGYLQTDVKLDELGQIFGINLSLPTDKYIKFYSLQSRGFNLQQMQSIDPKRIFSNAVTNKNFVKVSLKY